MLRRGGDKDDDDEQIMKTAKRRLRRKMTAYGAKVKFLWTINGGGVVYVSVYNKSFTIVEVLKEYAGIVVNEPLLNILAVYIYTLYYFMCECASSFRRAVPRSRGTQLFQTKS